MWGSDLVNGVPPVNAVIKSCDYQGWVSSKPAVHESLRVARGGVLESVGKIHTVEIGERSCQTEMLEKTSERGRHEIVVYQWVER